jgi:selT/selW/selH-like putative selenoprotein
VAELSGRGFDAEAVAGETGQFDVRAGDRLVFSKAETGRFPDDGEVLTALEPR